MGEIKTKFDALSPKERVAILGAIGDDGINDGRTYNVVEVNNDYHIVRKVYKRIYNGYDVIDYVLNDNGGNWIVEKWKTFIELNKVVANYSFKDFLGLFSEPELDTIFGGPRDKESERRFECECISVISKDEALDTAFRITDDDIDSVLDSDFSELDKQKYYAFSLEERHEKFTNSMSEQWFEDTRCSLQAILDN